MLCELDIHLQGTKSLTLYVEVYVFLDEDLVVKMLEASILVILVVEILVVELMGLGKTKDGKDN